MSLNKFLAEHPPEVISDTIDPAEMETMLRQASVLRETLTEEAKQSLEFFFSYWVMTALTRNDDLATVLLMDRLCMLAVRFMPFSVRVFYAYRDLLEIKRHNIARARGSPPRQSGQVLAILDGSERPFSELITKMNVSAERLNQLLLVMEECRLVTMRRKLDMSLTVIPLVGFCPLRAEGETK